jgi:RimJ/RimL family protein N-acetyltransferase
MELSTKRLVLRGFAADDWEDVHDLAIDWSKAPGPAFDKWPTTEEAASGLTEHFSASPKYYAVCLMENGKVVGLLALNGYETEGRFDLGHVIHSDYQDNDIDREALQAIVDHIFRTEDATAVVTHNDPTHREQLAPLVASGFTNA